MSEHKDFHPNYRKPPVEHQFKPGQSGNPRGRPVKRERSLTSLQVMRDTIAVMNTKVKVRRSGGTSEITVYEALLQKAAQRAMDGHSPLIRFCVERFERAIQTHEVRGKQYFPKLDQLELQIALHPPAKEWKNATEAGLNEWRKDTQRT